MEKVKTIEKWMAIEIAIPRRNNEMFPKRIKIICEGLYPDNIYGYEYYSRYYINCDTNERKENPETIRFWATNDGTICISGSSTIIEHIFPDIYRKTRFRTRCYDYTNEMKKEVRKEKLQKIWQES